MDVTTKENAPVLPPLPPLDESSVPSEPFELFAEWLERAARCDLITDYNAMCLSTSGDGGPDGRIVLLRRYDNRGFVFFTNTLSAKGRALGTNPNAALTFFWDPLRRQIRIRGAVAQISPAEADEYFAGRPRLSQVGAWASKQSETVSSRAALDQQIAATEKSFADQAVPRPPHWTGYRVTPSEIEFWQERNNRLHDRLLYRRSGSDWSVARLYP